MLWDLTRALAAATVVGVVPGYLWAACLCATADRVERFVYGIGLSLMLVPTMGLLQAKLFGTGLSLTLAISSVLLVFGGGVAAYMKFGPAKKSYEPLAPRSAPLDLPTLVPLIAALGLAFAADSHAILAGWTGPLILLLVLAAGMARMLDAGNPTVPEPPAEALIHGPETKRESVARYVLLGGVISLALVRGYLGPLRHDWPYIRGVDGYEHVVMTNMTISTGSTESFMLYPPGFHYLMAMISQLSGMDAMNIFPVLAPTLLALVALGCYTLARRMWGWPSGVAAAFFIGVVSYGSYMHFAEARYPNLLTVHFLFTLAVGALIVLFAAPTRRSGILLALLGSSAVLYHQVATLYEVVLFGLATLCFLPYLLMRDSRRGFAMLYSFALLGVLAVVFAWDTYDLPQAVAGLFGGSEGGEGGEALGMALGTQPPLTLTHLLAMISHPVMWFGVLGAVLLAVERGRTGAPYALGRAFLLIWGLLLFVGSRTEASGFPERFERDLAIPLALLAGFALVTLLRSLRPRRTVAVAATSLAVVLSAALIGLQTFRNLDVSAGPVSQIPPQLITTASQRMLTPKIEDAGEWLRANNTGGNILVSPYVDLVPSRAILALGGYTGMQSYDSGRIELARDLPPFGAKPLEDALFMLGHPNDERTFQLLEKYDVRYVVLYKQIPPPSEMDFRAFKSSKSYEEVFENERVVIFAPKETAPGDP